MHFKQSLQLFKVVFDKFVQHLGYDFETIHANVLFGSIQNWFNIGLYMLVPKGVGQETVPCTLATGVPVQYRQSDCTMEVTLVCHLRNEEKIKVMQVSITSRREYPGAS